MTDTIESRWEQQNEAGRLSFTDGDYARAEQSFLAAIREATQLGPDNVRLASSLSNLGQLKYKQKDLGQAEALFHRALAIRERVLGPEHFGLVQNINNLAALHYARGELDQAEPLFQRALAISEQNLGEAHPDVAVTLNNLARLYFRRADYASAAPLLSRLLAIKEQSLGMSHPEIAAIVTSLAKVRVAAGDYDGGEQFARRALAIREKLQLPNDLAIAMTLDTLAEICGARGQTEDELGFRARALDVRATAMGNDHPAVIAARAALASRLAAQDSVAVDAPAIAPPTPVPPAPPAAPPVAPPRTTRTTSLPWIQAPTPPPFKRMTPPSIPQYAAALNGNGATATKPAESPLAFHPSVASPPPLAVAPPAVLESPFTNSFARLIADTPSAPDTTAVATPSPREVEILPEPRREISLDWPIEPRRPWLRIGLGIAAVALLAAGGWFFSSRSKTADASEVVAAGSRAPASIVPPALPDSAAPRRDSLPKGIKPASPKAAVPEAVSSASDAKHAAHATGGEAAAHAVTPPEPDVIATPKLPTLKVDAITNMIDDSARRRADSVGRAIPQKPPTFKPKVYRSGD
jgi:tetratricopeptide (TPR) repeat protein